MSQCKQTESNRLEIERSTGQQNATNKISSAWITLVVDYSQQFFATSFTWSNNNYTKRKKKNDRLETLFVKACFCLILWHTVLLSCITFSEWLRWVRNKSKKKIGFSLALVGRTIVARITEFKHSWDRSNVEWMSSNGCDWMQFVRFARIPRKYSTFISIWPSFDLRSETSSSECFDFAFKWRIVCFKMQINSLFYNFREI